ncbi:hypothetical protein HanXRQr2_Chr09g0367151 [Helianthus annuus]|uniref:Uncharacterized protein n=1 Tax=Helianthus annuus TaxID=4232 RepID=A0A9K3I352_HELAN|nr:hypothetical protein HanXRQr2_Chr09g0367151 [Helianthus annuus]KAJ0891430.1 hypothetical protein HanPSC8_Chr09g0353671 [Helianthus annuus]
MPEKTSTNTSTTTCRTVMKMVVVSEHGGDAVVAAVVCEHGGGGVFMQVKGTRGGITSDGFHHSHYPIRKCHVINHISITSDRNGLGVESLVMGIPIYKY